jgi:hypothetical protein
VEVSGVQLSDNSVAVAPNPTGGNAYVMIKGAENVTARIVVSDITGKTVFTTESNISGNQANIEIPASALLVKGMYLVQTTLGKTVNTQKLVVY